MESGHSVVPTLLLRTAPETKTAARWPPFYCHHTFSLGRFLHTATGRSGTGKVSTIDRDARRLRHGCRPTWKGIESYFCRAGQSVASPHGTLQVALDLQSSR